jgi:hypothetical protein
VTGEADDRLPAHRPIADAFWQTARWPVAACVRLGVHPDAVSYASIVVSAAAAADHPSLRLWPR